MKCQTCGKEFSAKVYEIHVKDCKKETEKTENVIEKNKGGRPKKGGLICQL